MDLNSPWLILLLPLLAAALNTLLFQRSRPLAAAVSLAAVWGAFAVALSHLPTALAGDGSWSVSDSVTWLSAGGVDFRYGYLLDGLSLIMLLVVTGVGGLIHIYSLGYMHDDPGFPRFFTCLSLFMFSMLGIVLSDNFFQIFIHWELVGVSSYLLIGFYYRKDSAAAAANKAFLTNRVGDFGFMLGILMLAFATKEALAAGAGFGNFRAMADVMAQPGWLAQTALEVGGRWTLTNEHFLWIAGALTFMGVMGKSAQFPLHVWLPDAMEGPTPVSALIHAATMVVAGVYLTARMLPLFEHVRGMPELITSIGLVTTILAAFMGLAQRDIKRVVAYSTLNSLGLMFVALGAGAVGAAMLYLFTHAFFKALLFLASGSVIHATEEQEVDKLGGLWSRMPITAPLFVVGALAMAGLVPLSGFWAKDEILVGLRHAPLNDFFLIV
ncbi:MAG: NADH-quinone oxidoreductase subunit 5 family protein, partial [Planctomycetota bacterium]